MSFSFDTAYAIWLIPACLIFSAGIVLLLYRNYKHFGTLKKWQKYLLYSLRFVFVFLIAFLLLAPLVKFLEKKIIDPIIIVAQDNSGSVILNPDSTYYKNEYPNQTVQFIHKLSSDFQVDQIEFGDVVKDTISFGFSDKQTDLSALFRYIEKKYFNRNVGAIVLASDGIINHGDYPMYLLNDLNVPVYSVALGDTIRKKDIILSNVKYNKMAYLGNNFPVKITSDIIDLKDASTELSIIHKEKTVFTKKIIAKSSDYTDETIIDLEAKESGVQYYKIVLSDNDKEVTHENNSTIIAIDVVNGKQKILLLADAPHPDIAAIKSAVKTNLNYDITYSNLDDFHDDINKYNMVIMYGLPGKSKISSELLKQIYRNKISVLFIISTGTDVKYLNSLQPGLKIYQSNNAFEESLPLLNSSFTLFKIDDFKDLFNNTTPLITPFGEYSLSPDQNVLLYQKIKEIETNKPLLIFSNTAGHKTGIIAGEGLWRWKIYDYLNNTTHENFNRFINKIVQYLSLKINKNKFVVDVKTIYNELEDIVIYAEIYNDNYELINMPDVSLDIIDNKNKKYSFKFDKTSYAYKLSAGNLPVGEYTYIAHVDINGKNLVRKGVFSVIEVNTEALTSMADHKLLKQISDKTNGGFFYPSDYGKIYEQIKSNPNIVPISFSNKIIKEIINYKWLFFVIISFAGIEWFLRKYYGSY